MILETPPENIWLQYHGDDDPEDCPVDMAEITWSNEQIFGSDIQYIRADVARRADRKAREECAELCATLANSLHGGPAESAARQCAKYIRATITEE